MVKTYEHVGHLYKKRGGLGRHSRSPWVSRTFALGYDGVLAYFDSESLRQPRRTLNLPRSEATLSTVFDESDESPTRFMLIITHVQGQRWKLCAESSEDLEKWKEKMAKHCRADLGGRIVSSRPSPGSLDGSELRGDSVVSDECVHVRRHANGTPLTSPRPGGAGKKGRRASKMTATLSGPQAVLPRLEIVSALAVVNLAGAAALFSESTGAAIVVLVLINLYVAGIVARSCNQAPPRTETLVSLMVPPARLPNVIEDAKKALSEGKKADSVGDRTPTNVSAPSRLCAGGTGLNEVPFDAEGGSIGTWSVAPASTFKIRQLGYMKSKRKAPSEPAFFEVVSVDLFDTDTRVNTMSEHLELPTPVTSSPDPDVPSLFVVNAQIPSETGSIRTKLDADGHGYQVVICMQMTQQTRDELGRIDELPPKRANALRLLRHYCKVAPTEPQGAPKERGRFKVLAQIRNIDEVNIPNFAKGYNGKPALIAKTGHLTRTPDHVALEMDINIHAFGYAARAGLQSIYRDFQDFILTIGFVIEGRDDTELPETLLAAVDLNHMDWTMAVPL